MFTLALICTSPIEIAYCHLNCQTVYVYKTFLYLWLWRNFSMKMASWNRSLKGKVECGTRRPPCWHSLCYIQAVSPRLLLWSSLSLVYIRGGMDHPDRCHMDGPTSAQAGDKQNGSAQMSLSSEMSKSHYPVSNWSQHSCYSLLMFFLLKL